MQGSNIMGQEWLWYPFKSFGITNAFTAININTIIGTWVSIGVIILLILISRYFLNKKNSIGQYLIKELSKSFIDLIEQTIGKFVEKYYLFIASLFLYIIICNWIGILHYIEEPTKDLNTTLALGLTAFIYMHKEMIKSHGFIAYLKDLFLPFDIIFPFNIIAGLVMLPLKLLGEFATVLSISFRLFGNIFGGYIIGLIYHNAISGSILLSTIGILTGVNFLIASFFIIFEGFLQAFVFSILTLTNIAMAVQTENEGNIL